MVRARNISMPDGCPRTISTFWPFVRSLAAAFPKTMNCPHGPKAVILSYGLWRSVFDRNPKILGDTVLLKGEPYTVVGVLPDHAITPLNADLYIAIQANREGEGRGANFTAVLRLRDGATWEQANAEMNRAFSQSQQVQSRTRKGAQMTYDSVPLQKAQTEMLAPQSLGLMIAAGFILLIACANLAGLTLVRLLRRTGEISTRLALGASPWQIQKQLWSECLPLALAGGAAGIAVGFAALRGLLLLLPEHYLPVACPSRWPCTCLHPGPCAGHEHTFRYAARLGREKD